MLNKCSCVICKKQYSRKGIHTHADRAHGTEETKAKYSSGHNGKYNDPTHRENLKKSLKEFYDSDLGKNKSFEVSCHKCETKFNVIEREKQFPTKEKYFCSRSCANTKTHSEETKQKIRDKRAEQIIPKKVYKKDCPQCSNAFETYKGKQVYCSSTCARNHRAEKSRENRSAYRNYRADCEFKFSLNDYPEEFDFSLIEEHGWYSAANRGNNLYGVSRDHIVSVKYGLENGIDPTIISHPANCQLLLHSDNVSKYTNNDLTVDQLLEKIAVWNDKY